MRLQLGQSNGRNSGLRNYRILMAGIQLRNHPAWEEAAKERDIDAIYGFVEGDVPMKLRFLAEPVCSPLAGICLEASRKRGRRKNTQWNFLIFCAADLFLNSTRRLKTTTRFFPTRYEALPNPTGLGGDTSLSTVYFISDEEELAAFSWTAEVVNDLLRRSMHVQV
ncbi:MAG: hypothetical protein V8R75_02610 [Oscillospiraceae bacterium]